MSDHGTVSAWSPSTERIAEILDIAEDGIIAVNLEQKIILFNRGAERIFGYRKDEILGRPLDVLIPDEVVGKHRHHLRDFSHSAHQSRLMGERSSVFGKRKDGRVFPAEVSICKLPDNGKTLFTAILRDVTKQKETEKSILQWNEELERRVERRTSELSEANRKLQDALTGLQLKTEELRSTTQQLWQSAKLASVGELAASIAHELNNPLGTVSLRIESTLAMTPENDPRAAALQIVEQEVERMGRLVGNLLQFCRFGREQVSTVDLTDEIRMAAELTQYHLKRRKIAFLPEISPTVPPIFADRQKIRQVFLNLFTNAADAMPDGGVLNVRVSPSSLRDGRASVTIEVIDCGIGIPAEILPRVMDPFFTTKEEGKGTGLGLAICRRIVQEHQGQIEIESRPNEGTTVRVTIPIQSGGNVEGLEHE